MIHFSLIMAHFCISMTNFLLSMTHFLLSMTHFLLSMTHFLLSMTHFCISMTHFLISKVVILISKLLQMKQLPCIKQYGVLGLRLKTIITTTHHLTELWHNMLCKCEQNMLRDYKVCSVCSGQTTL